VNPNPWARARKFAEEAAGRRECALSVATNDNNTLNKQKEPALSSCGVSRML